MNVSNEDKLRPRHIHNTNVIFRSEESFNQEHINMNIPSCDQQTNTTHSIDNDSNNIDNENCENNVSKQANSHDDYNVYPFDPNVTCLPSDLLIPIIPGDDLDKQNTTIISTTHETLVTEDKTEEELNNNSQRMTYPDLNMHEQITDNLEGSETLSESSFVEENIGQFILKKLLMDFFMIASDRIDDLMNEPMDKPIFKFLQKGECAQFDQVLEYLSAVSEYALPSILKTLIKWRSLVLEELYNERTSPRTSHDTCFQDVMTYETPRIDNLEHNINSNGNLEMLSSPISYNTMTTANCHLLPSNLLSGLVGAATSLMTNSLNFSAPLNTSSGTNNINGNVGVNGLSPNDPFNNSNPSHTLTNQLLGNANLSTGSNNNNNTNSNNISASQNLSSFGTTASSPSNVIASHNRTSNSHSVASTNSTVRNAINNTNSKQIIQTSSLCNNPIRCNSIRKQLAVEYVYCLSMIQVVPNIKIHPDHEDLYALIDNQVFNHILYPKAAFETEFQASTTLLQNTIMNEGRNNTSNNNNNSSVSLLANTNNVIHSIPRSESYPSNTASTQSHNSIPPNNSNGEDSTETYLSHHTTTASNAPIEMSHNHNSSNNANFSDDNVMSTFCTNQMLPNHNIVFDIYAELLGALADARFTVISKRIIKEINKCRPKDTSYVSSEPIINLLMGIKFIRIQMLPMEELEEGFKLLRVLATYFLETKDKEIRNVLSAIMVDIIIPIASVIKTEVNIPIVKSFVEFFYPPVIDMIAKKKNALTLVPLATSLLCISQKQFFTSNFQHILNLCVNYFKTKDTKLCRLALEALYRLIWVYMIRLNGESNALTMSRLTCITGSLFPKGCKTLIPKDAPFNIFIKIIQFIAQKKRDFVLQDIIVELICSGKIPPVKLVSPERLCVGIRALLVVTDSSSIVNHSINSSDIPPMPQNLVALPSCGLPLVKRNKISCNTKPMNLKEALLLGLTEESFLAVTKSFTNILNLLDNSVGKAYNLIPNATTNGSSNNNGNGVSVNKKEYEELIVLPEKRARIELFKTCVAALPRFFPSDAKSQAQNIELLIQLTTHCDEKLRGQATQVLQILYNEHERHRSLILKSVITYVLKNVTDNMQDILESFLSFLTQLLSANEKFCCDKQSNSSLDILEFKKTLNLLEALLLIMIAQNNIKIQIMAFDMLEKIDLIIQNLWENNLILKTNHIRSAYQTIKLKFEILFNETLAIYNDSDELTNIKYAFKSQNIKLYFEYIMMEDDETKKQKLLHTFLTVVLGEFYEPLLPLSLRLECWNVTTNRIGYYFQFFDPNIVLLENRASLLRPSIAKKTQVNEREKYRNPWQTYVILAFCLMPKTYENRDLNIKMKTSYISESSTLNRSNSHSPEAISGKCDSDKDSILTSFDYDKTLDTSPSHLTSISNCSSLKKDYFFNTSYDDSNDLNNFPDKLHSNKEILKLFINILVGCETLSYEMRQPILHALNYISPSALKLFYVSLESSFKEALELKQENVRRKRKREILRCHLLYVMALLAEKGIHTYKNALNDFFPKLQSKSTFVHQEEPIDFPFVFLPNIIQGFIKCSYFHCDVYMGCVKPNLVSYSSAMIENNSANPPISTKQRLITKPFALVNSLTSGVGSSVAMLTHRNEISKLPERDTEIFVKHKEKLTLLEFNETTNEMYLCNFSRYINNIIKHFELDQRWDLFDITQIIQMFNYFNNMSGRLGLHKNISDFRKINKPPPLTPFEIMNFNSLLIVMTTVSLQEKRIIPDYECLFKWFENLLLCSQKEVVQITERALTNLLIQNNDFTEFIEWILCLSYSSDMILSSRLFFIIAQAYCVKEFSYDMIPLLTFSLIYLYQCNTSHINRSLAIKFFNALDTRFFQCFKGFTNNESTLSTYKTIPSYILYASSDIIMEFFSNIHPELTLSFISELLYRMDQSHIKIKRNLLKALCPWLKNLTLAPLNINIQSYFLHDKNASKTKTKKPYYYEDNSSVQQKNSINFELFKGAHLTGRYHYNYNFYGNFNNHHKPKQIYNHIGNELKHNRQFYLTTDTTLYILNNLFYSNILHINHNLDEEYRQVWGSLVHNASFPVLINNFLVLIDYLTTVIVLMPESNLENVFACFEHVSQTLDPSLVIKLLVQHYIEWRKPSLRTPSFFINCASNNVTKIIERCDYAPYFRKILKYTHSETDGNISLKLPLKISNFDNDRISDDIFDTETLRKDYSHFIGYKHSVSPLEDIYVHDPNDIPYPMPAYGGYNAPFNELLNNSMDEENPPTNDQNSCGFSTFLPRCFMGIMLINHLEFIKLDLTDDLIVILHIISMGLINDNSYIRANCTELLLKILIRYAWEFNYFHTCHQLSIFQTYYKSSFNNLKASIPFFSSNCEINYTDLCSDKNILTALLASDNNCNTDNLPKPPSKHINVRSNGNSKKEIPSMKHLMSKNEDLAKSRISLLSEAPTITPARLEELDRDIVENERLLIKRKKTCVDYDGISTFSLSETCDESDNDFNHHSPDDLTRFQFDTLVVHPKPFTKKNTIDKCEKVHNIANPESSNTTNEHLQIINVLKNNNKLDVEQIHVIIRAVCTLINKFSPNTNIEQNWSKVALSYSNNSPSVDMVCRSLCLFRNFKSVNITSLVMIELIFKIGNIIQENSLHFHNTHVYTDVYFGELTKTLLFCVSKLIEQTFAEKLIDNISDSDSNKSDKHKRRTYPFNNNINEEEILIYLNNSSESTIADTKESIVKEFAKPLLQRTISVKSLENMSKSGTVIIEDPKLLAKTLASRSIKLSIIAKVYWFGVCLCESMNKSLYCLGLKIIHDIFMDSLWKPLYEYLEHSKRQSLMTNHIIQYQLHKRMILQLQKFFVKLKWSNFDSVAMLILRSLTDETVLVDVNEERELFKLLSIMLYFNDKLFVENPSICPQSNVNTIKPRNHIKRCKNRGLLENSINTKQNNESKRIHVRGNETPIMIYVILLKLIQEYKLTGNDANQHRLMCQSIIRYCDRNMSKGETTDALNNMKTIMQMFQNKTFNKSEDQWVKCVTTYLLDAFPDSIIPLVETAIKISHQWQDGIAFPAIRTLYTMIELCDITCFQPVHFEKFSLLLHISKNSKLSSDISKIFTLLVKKCSHLTIPMSARLKNPQITMSDMHGVEYSKTTSFVDIDELFSRRKLSGPTIDFSLKLKLKPVPKTKNRQDQQSQNLLFQNQIPCSTGDDNLTVSTSSNSNNMISSQTNINTNESEFTKAKRNIENMLLTNNIASLSPAQTPTQFGTHLTHLKALEHPYHSGLYTVKTGPKTQQEKFKDRLLKYLNIFGGNRDSSSVHSPSFLLSNGSRYGQSPVCRNQSYSSSGGDNQTLTPSHHSLGSNNASKRADKANGRDVRGGSLGKILNRKNMNDCGSVPQSNHIRTNCDSGNHTRSNSRDDLSSAASTTTTMRVWKDFDFLDIELDKLQDDEISVYDLDNFHWSGLIRHQSLMSHHNPSNVRSNGMACSSSGTKYFINKYNNNINNNHFGGICSPTSLSKYSLSSYSSSLSALTSLDDDGASVSTLNNFVAMRGKNTNHNGTLTSQMKDLTISHGLNRASNVEQNNKNSETTPFYGTSNYHTPARPHSLDEYQALQLLSLSSPISSINQSTSNSEFNVGKYPIPELQKSGEIKEQTEPHDDNNVCPNNIHQLTETRFIKSLSCNTIIPSENNDFSKKNPNEYVNKSINKRSDISDVDNVKNKNQSLTTINQNMTTSLAGISGLINSPHDLTINPQLSVNMSENAFYNEMGGILFSSAHRGNIISPESPSLSVHTMIPDNENSSLHKLTADETDSDD